MRIAMSTQLRDRLEDTNRAVYEVLSLIRVIVRQWDDHSPRPIRVYQLLEVLCVARRPLIVFVIYERFYNWTVSVV